MPAISNKLADIPPDDYSWRKYGQKPIKGSPHPRYTNIISLFSLLCWCCLFIYRLILVFINVMQKMLIMFIWLAILWADQLYESRVATSFLFFWFGEGIVGLHLGIFLILLLTLLCDWKILENLLYLSARVLRKEYAIEFFAEVGEFNVVHLSSCILYFMHIANLFMRGTSHSAKYFKHGYWKFNLKFGTWL